MKVLLKGVVGSTAYGLAHPGSDIDHLGVFAASTEEILGLHPPKDSRVTHDPDMTLHEAKKFVSLVLRGNPSVSELLWLDRYERVDPLGEKLISLRRSFLSAPRVRDAYMGYAASQFSRLPDRGDGSFSADTRKRTERHARHLVRLVEQGFHLYVSGELVVNLSSDASEISPDWVYEMGREIAADPQTAVAYMGAAKNRFDSASTCLPEKPDEEAVNNWLIEVRRREWKSKGQWISFPAHPLSSSGSVEQ